MTFKNLPEEHQTFITAELELARSLIEKKGEIRATMFALSPNQGVIPIFLDGAPKGLAGSLISRISEHMPLIFMVEAWMTHITVAPDSAIGKAIRNDPNNAVITAPHDDPDRKEVVMVQFHHQDRKIIYSALMTRQDGKVTLGEWKFTDNNDEASMVRGVDFSPAGATYGCGDIE